VTRRWTLVAILGATFMLLVDVTIIQVALPTIQGQLHASFTNLAWVIDAYALTLAALILTSGTLADRFGRRRIFVWGVGIFTAASALCGVATSALFLDIARGLQGVGGAAMFATSLALIGQEFTGRERGNAIALWGATIGGAVAVGPLLGGVLTEWLSWRWIFYVNLPIGIAVIALAQRHIENLRDPEARTADVAGLVTFSGALSLLVFALLRGNDSGWSSGLILGCFAGAAVLFVTFLVVELRQKRPMLDLALFRRPAFCGVSLGTFAIGAGMFAMFPWISLYLQNDLEYSPLQGGLRMLPATLLAFVVPILARRFASGISPAVHLWVGLGIVAAGLALMLQLSPGSRWTALLPGLVVVGFGIGLANPAIGQLALAVAPPERAGMASGISNTCRIGGLAMGFAGLGALLQDRLWARLHALVPTATHQLANVIASAGPRAAAHRVGAGAQLIAAGRDASVAGLDAAFLAGSIVLALGCILVLALVRIQRPAAPVAIRPGGP
jgi:EmrB/QacA subfamily drug resistance transporter